ncbi:MAG: hypothetical protein QMC67_01975 [Candidatus Wallbacteria bacterium]
MIYQAVIKKGGIFIPDIDARIFKKNKARIDIVIVTNDKKTKNPILKTSGILKDKVIDGLEFEKKIREEWYE